MAGIGLVAATVGVLADPVAACSPPFDPPTLRDLGPRQVVVVGTTGDRVAGGRLFHVERWFNGDVPMTPIVIGFKEGEPTGDCSYPVSAGTHMVIAPARLEDGTLYADLVTLQADPDSEAGRAYVAEAVALYGPGVVPGAGGGASSDAPDDDDVGLILAVLAGVLALGAVAAIGFVVAGRPWQH